MVKTLGIEKGIMFNTPCMSKGFKFLAVLTQERKKLNAKTQGCKGAKKIKTE
jgi:hypothetical protein